MSPYLSNVTSLFSGDLATFSAEIKQLRADVLVADINLAREEADGVGAEEIAVRYVAARGDHRVQSWLRRLAAEYDADQRFGPRLIDELDTLDALNLVAA